MTVKGCLD